MKLHDLKPAPGSTRKTKRVGRGHGSGKGKTSGKGMMGQKARSGPNPYPHFEGGQNPLVRRMPYKRGFTNIFRVEYTIVNVGDLTEWNNGDVTPETLREVGLIKNLKQPIKVLGDGDLNVALKVRVHKVSASARQKIEAAGGSVELIDAAA
ncbi:MULTISPECIES: 50S ribosomal protein L15 [Herpetosiphon]|uniref:Large ribosomal subunit protein uL15 n=1 Tax=Herpetosiphon geysericola TaxID=70996 RepID=A0A0N8GR54_9CHLR|nr:50S ribosomal protein L15 [Herpetosiphon geysericola]KPL85546.1 50S ribosomal protein L15 [Herpetosiphon geysericola]